MKETELSVDGGAVLAEDSLVHAHNHSMSYLQPLSDFVEVIPEEADAADYHYEGRCPDSGAWLRLPRTALAKAAAQGCMRALEVRPISPEEGKMYGVLVVETTRGTVGVLQAFSGQIQGASLLRGWVPPLPGHEGVALDEVETLAFLAAAKDELIALSQSPCLAALEVRLEVDEEAYKALVASHKKAKKARKAKREEYRAALSSPEDEETLAEALKRLDEESHTQSLERRDFRWAQAEARAALEAEVADVEGRIKALRQARKRRSRALQAQMHATYALTNFAGQTLPLQALATDGNLPTGTGDCCAPKLLYYAATHGLKPLGMAEFWWGASPPNGSKQEGTFYGACEERCVPIMGFLLSGLPATPTAPSVDVSLQLDVVYEDDDMIVFNKPSGLLSVPGRTSDAYDSVCSRVQHLFPDVTGSVVVHRLDMETSGLLVVGRHPESHRALSAAFKQRRVEKHYVALVCGDVPLKRGEIRLPLAPDPARAPRQCVDHQDGRSSLTKYEVLGREDDGVVRLLLSPHTGRTHQLRVHTAHPEGLGAPILGDSLYGPTPTALRLHLHARDLRLPHPVTGEMIELTCPVPF